MGGAVSRVAPEATAYYHRQSAYNLSIIGSWIQKSDDDVNIAWLKSTWNALSPHLPNRVYVNVAAG
jgi:hypothetical protein